MDAQRWTRIEYLYHCDDLWLEHVGGSLALHPANRPYLVMKRFTFSINRSQ
jgi:hypothetical protein